MPPCPRQSGLIAESIVDITPRKPLPTPVHSPLDPGCESEGLIVCHRGTATGVTGVSLDDLVSVCTRLARKMEALGMETMFDTAETANKLMKDVGPLMVQAQRIAEELRPLLSEVRQGGMVTSLDSLMESATAIAEDARRLNNGIITKDNIELVRTPLSLRLIPHQWRGHAPRSPYIQKPLWSLC